MIMRGGNGESQQTPGDLILERIIEVNPDAVFVEGFNQAIIAMDSVRRVVIYDMQRFVDLLVQNDGMDEDEAEEFFHFNVGNVSMGPNTPLFVYSINPRDEMPPPAEQPKFNGERADWYGEN